MAGGKEKGKRTAAAPAPAHLQEQTRTTTSVIRADPNLGYKLRVLLHDFRSIRTNRAAQERISQTIDPLYISAPYFTPEEATRIKGAIVNTYTNINECIDGQDFGEDSEQEEKTKPVFQSQTQTAEEMIQSHFANFLEKRKPSGDSRPCGPHDMAPIYQSIFGIAGTELEEENFLRRLRRAGLKMN
ncbi:putative C6 transcription factor [Annulohypoxylon truncatum]|uniref:putative C6 transcription factor n=1 Tax=Annulohypoxylon truncatum TaxID=327061 RepID=UPI0020087EF3|nr:putative C6 transcription factor [Annulohypoxylon truncatum]KAI1204887.1 putative C6 transcription factor [Annulohypoxylon truncatum]